MTTIGLVILGVFALLVSFRRRRDAFTRRCCGARPCLVSTAVVLTLFAALAEASAPIARESRQPAAQITVPSARATVPSVFIARGKLRRLPAGRSAWLAVRIGAGYWPKCPRPLPVGTWRCEVDEPGTGLPRGHTFDLVIIAVDTAGRREIQAWFVQGRATGSYPALALSVLHGQVLAHKDRLRIRR